MNTQFDTGMITLIAGEAVQPYRFVKKDAATVVYADADENAFAITQRAADENAGVTIKLLKNSEGTFQIEAAGIIAINADIYPTADGKATSTAGTGDIMGFANEASTVAGQLIEMIAK